MAIIQCPKCQGKLKFPDDSPPRRVKCPACAHGFLAGPDGPKSDSGERSTAKASDALSKVTSKKNDVEEDFEVVDDDDKPAKSKARDDDDDDRDRKKKRTRDEDDEDDDRDRKKKRARDDDDEDDDRDRKKKRARDDDDDDDDRFRSKRRDDDDDDDDRDRKKRRDDDDEDDDDDRPRNKKKKKARRDDDDGSSVRTTRTQWEWARKGISFVNYGFFCQMGSFGGLLLAFLISWMGGHEPVILALACIPGLVGFILAGVGFGFIIAGPRRGNMLGLAIALAAVAGVHLLLTFIAAFGEKSMGGFYVRTSVDWIILSTSFLEFALMVVMKHGEALIICVGLFEIARFVLLTLYLKEFGKVCKEREATGRCTMLMIALPSAVAGSILVALLGGYLLREAQPSLTFLQIFGLLYIIVKLGAYTFIYLLTVKTANEISDAAYKMY